MRRLHEWYLDASSHKGLITQGVMIKDEHYFHGEDLIWLRFEELYQLYHQDAYQTRAHWTVHITYILQDKGWDMAHALH
jgi:hypothetical protein